jgi:DNA-directed RNA polymerase sigma subunit (sigma70/sigma32)
MDLLRPSIGSIVVLSPNLLTPFESWVISRRHPGNGGKPATFKALERECGLASYRLMAIEREALAKLNSQKESQGRTEPP